MWLIGWLHGSCKRKGRETFEEHCTTCKEYDQKNHCCHRWTDCIRRTVDELKDYYDFHSIKEKPDEDGKYLVQYEGDIISIQNFDADENAFGMWSSQPADVCGYWPCEKGKGQFIIQESCIVAWARLPERYKNDNT